jgi:hypothetical protein
MVSAEVNAALMSCLAGAVVGFNEGSRANSLNNRYLGISLRKTRSGYEYVVGEVVINLFSRQ